VPTFPTNFALTLGSVPPPAIARNRRRTWSAGYLHPDVSEQCFLLFASAGIARANLLLTQFYVDSEGSRPCKTNGVKWEKQMGLT
jgi:hypothetical protein